MAVLDEIEVWFKRRARWEWHAYSAIVSCEPIDNTTVKRLAALCVEDAVSPSKSVPEVPSRPPEASVRKSVSILSIENVRGINRLTSGQKLTFQPVGVTVVYGDNGAGKTGYTRILRQVCRARGETSVILGDVFSDGSRAESADVVFLDGGEEKRATCRANEPVPCPLQYVSIFDARCGTALVNNENDAAFRPFGLDILDRFTTLAEQVRTQLKTDAIMLGKAALDVEQFPVSTRIGAMLRLLPSAAASAELLSLQPLTTGEIRVCSQYI